MEKYTKALQFSKLVGARYPIIQAPMAGVSTVSLAAEVTNNGGLGSLALSGIDLREGIDRVVATVSEYSNLVAQKQPFLSVNLNFFCHAVQPVPTEEQITNWWNLYRKAVPQLQSISESEISFANGNISFKEVEQLHSVVIGKLIDYWRHNSQLTPRIVSFHFGYPEQKTIDALHDVGILVFVTSTSPLEAEVLISKGVDGLICQGYEAGGHRGNFLLDEHDDSKLSTLDLFLATQKIVARGLTNVHLVPAGGIMDGTTVGKYLSLGASAAQIGSAFLTCPESNSNGYIEQLLTTNNLPFTEMVTLVSGKPARTIVTPFIRDLLASYETAEHSIAKSGQEHTNYELPPYGHSYKAYKDLKQKLGRNSNVDIGFYLAGSNYRQIVPGLSAKEVLQYIVRELA